MSARLRPGDRVRIVYPLMFRKPPRLAYYRGAFRCIQHGHDLGWLYVVQYRASDGVWIDNLALLPSQVQRIPHGNVPRPRVVASPGAA